MTTTMTTKLRGELTALLSYLNGAQLNSWLGYHDNTACKGKGKDFHYLAISADPNSGSEPPLRFPAPPTTAFFH